MYLYFNDAVKDYETSFFAMKTFKTVFELFAKRQPRAKS